MKKIKTKEPWYVHALAFCAVPIGFAVLMGAILSMVTFVESLPADTRALVCGFTLFLMLGAVGYATWRYQE